MNGSQTKWCLGFSTFGNLVLNAGTNNIQSLTVGGFHSIVSVERGRC